MAVPVLNRVSMDEEIDAFLFHYGAYSVALISSASSNDNLPINSTGTNFLTACFCSITRGITSDSRILHRNTPIGKLLDFEVYRIYHVISLDHVFAHRRAVFVHIRGK